MPTYSGTTTYGITATQIITRSAAKIGILDTGETLDSNTQADFLQQLEIICKEVMAEGVGLWLRLTPTLFLQPGQESYQLGVTSTDHWTTAFAATTTAAAGSAGASTITVSSTTGIVSGYQIGITLSGSTGIFWTTVNGAPSGSTVTLTAPLSGAVNSGANVYCYQTQADRPQRLLYANRRYTTNLSQIMDVPLDIKAEMDYMNMPEKWNQSQPTMCALRPTIPNSTLFIWPTYDGASGYDQIQFVSEGLMEDIGVAGNNPYFPIEWANFLIWRLAFEMCYEFGVDFGSRDRLMQIAEQKKQVLLNYDTSEAQIQFGLRREGMDYYRG